FDTMAEYPIAIVLACLVPALRAGRDRENPRVSVLLAAAILALTCLLGLDVGGITSTAIGALCVMLTSGLFLYATWTLNRRPLAFALSVGAILLGTATAPGVGGRIL